MLVEFLKSHLQYEEGEIVELPDQTAAYLIKMGVVIEASQDADDEPSAKKEYKKRGRKPKNGV